MHCAKWVTPGVAIAKIGDVDVAFVGGRWAWEVTELSRDPSVLDGDGRWVVVLPYSGSATFIRFRHWSAAPPPGALVGTWEGPSIEHWRTSLAQGDYEAAVAEARRAIAAGTVYQVNVCRVLDADVPVENNIVGLHALLARGNAAPYSSCIRVKDAGLEIASASPELFLRRDGRALRTSPIKGTGRTAADLQPKDEAENVMIVDLMRNDLNRVCEPGTVRVPELLRQEEHPGLVHLVSDVVGQLRPDVTWGDVIAATFPPGSVTGAPKSSALRLIDVVEPTSRGVYCGAIGWVDGTRHQAALAVAIRTFWREGDVLRFGTGAGITWGSDPHREWQETELKARRLISLAAGVWQGERS